MAGEEHDERGSIHFCASRSPDLRVVREQLRRPLSAFVYIDDKAARESLVRFAPNSVSGYHCNDKIATSLRRSEEHTSELQSLMRISYAVCCLKKKNQET